MNKFDDPVHGLLANLDNSAAKMAARDKLAALAAKIAELERENERIRSRCHPSAHLDDRVIEWVSKEIVGFISDGMPAKLAYQRARTVDLERESEGLKSLPFPGGFSCRLPDLIAHLESIAAEYCSPLHELAAVTIKSLQNRLQKAGGSREAIKAGIPVEVTPGACSGDCGGCGNTSCQG